MKHLLALLQVLSVLSCTNNKNESKQEAVQPAPSVEYSNPPADTGTTRPPAPTPRESVFPLGTYKTLPEIMKHLFSEGSTKSEVRKVQGEPDMVERIDAFQETWYYGNCEVHFKGQMVRGVVKDNKGIKYASLYGTLLFSPDEIEVALAQLLNERIMR